MWHRVLKQLKRRYRLAGLDLAALIEEPPWSQWFGQGNLAVIDVSDVGGGIVAWGIRIFEHVENSNYRLRSEDIHEISFPLGRIRESLRRRYRQVWTYDTQRARPSPRSDRLHFVCRH